MDEEWGIWISWQTWTGVGMRDLAYFLKWGSRY